MYGHPKEEKRYFLLSFPEQDKAVQDQLANQLFPKLVACP